MLKVQRVIDILTQLKNSSQIDEEKIDEAIDGLECMKDDISLEDDELIDTIDEMQDYLEFLLTGEEASFEDMQEQLLSMIDKLHKIAKK